MGKKNALLKNERRDKRNAVEKQTKNCTKKVAYASEADANASARAQSTPLGKTYRAYGCPACGLWHLTTRPVAVTKIRRTD